MAALALRPQRPVQQHGSRRSPALWPAGGTVLLLAVASLFVGVSDVSPADLLAGDAGAWQTVLVSRVPRTLALVLAGVALSIAGFILQLMARNRFVEPSTVGTVESATAGILVATLVLPGAPIMGKMLVAAVFAMAGTALFLAVLRRIPLRNTLIVPLVGIMLGGVIASVTTFVAYRFDLLQTLNTWMIGDFSGLVRGRYELLWIVAVLAVVGYLCADRFTVAGMGEEFTTNLGLDYRRTMNLGLVLVSLISAVVVVVVGAIPFLGLIVPNLVSLLIGDNVRRAVPWIAVVGAVFVLACDILGRIIRFPYEVPVGVIVSVVGSILFITLLVRRNAGAR
ncbi:ABC transporter permease [Arthrobacter sp. L77]|uniref:ABC transporter permease n=1 Tax=Arthrobacter sp. L77 TaxID=1496689 RepID=UPI000691C5E3|nr:ABC transporter permease [Arthrobacter sp. L77]